MAKIKIHHASDVHDHGLGSHHNHKHTNSKIDMDKVKIQRVKRNKKKATTQEKIIAGLGLGSTLLGGAGAISPKTTSSQIVRQQPAQTGSSVKDTLKRIFGETFGVQQAKAAGQTFIGYDPVTGQGVYYDAATDTYVHPDGSVATPPDANTAVPGYTGYTSGGAATPGGRSVGGALTGSTTAGIFVDPTLVGSSLNGMPYLGTSVNGFPIYTSGPGSYVDGTGNPVALDGQGTATSIDRTTINNAPGGRGSMLTGSRGNGAPATTSAPGSTPTGAPNLSGNGTSITDAVGGTTITTTKGVDITNLPAGTTEGQSWGTAQGFVFWHNGQWTDPRAGDQTFDGAGLHYTVDSSGRLVEDTAIYDKNNNKFYISSSNTSRVNSGDLLDAAGNPVTQFSGMINPLTGAAYKDGDQIAVGPGDVRILHILPSGIFNVSAYAPVGNTFQGYTLTPAGWANGPTVSFDTSTVKIDGKYVSTVSGVGATTWIDVQVKLPDGSVVEVDNWQQGATSVHDLNTEYPGSEPTGTFQILSMRAHTDPSDHSGSWSNLATGSGAIRVGTTGSTDTVTTVAPNLNSPSVYWSQNDSDAASFLKNLQTSNPALYAKIMAGYQTVTDNNGNVTAVIVDGVTYDMQTYANSWTAVGGLVNQKAENTTGPNAVAQALNQMSPAQLRTFYVGAAVLGLPTSAYVYVPQSSSFTNPAGTVSLPTPPTTITVNSPFDNIQTGQAPTGVNPAGLSTSAQANAALAAIAKYHPGAQLFEDMNMTGSFTTMYNGEDRRFWVIAYNDNKGNQVLVNVSDVLANMTPLGTLPNDVPVTAANITSVRIPASKLVSSAVPTVNVTPTLQDLKNQGAIADYAVDSSGNVTIKMGPGSTGLGAAAAGVLNNKVSQSDMDAALAKFAQNNVLANYPMPTTPFKAGTSLPGGLIDLGNGQIVAPVTDSAGNTTFILVYTYTPGSKPVLVTGPAQAVAVSGSTVSNLGLNGNVTYAFNPPAASPPATTAATTVNLGASLNNPATPDQTVVITSVTAYDANGVNSNGVLKNGYTIEIGGNNLSAYNQYALIINGGDYTVQRVNVSANKATLYPVFPANIPSGSTVKLRVLTSQPGVSGGILNNISFTYIATPAGATNTNGGNGGSTGSQTTAGLAPTVVKAISANHGKAGDQLTIVVSEDGQQTAVGHEIEFINPATNTIVANRSVPGPGAPVLGGNGVSLTVPSIAPGQYYVKVVSVFPGGSATSPAIVFTVDAPAATQAAGSNTYNAQVIFLSLSTSQLNMAVGDVSTVTVSVNNAGSINHQVTASSQSQNILFNLNRNTGVISIIAVAPGTATIRVHPEILPDASQDKIITVQVTGGSTNLLTTDQLTAGGSNNSSNGLSQASNLAANQNPAAAGAENGGLLQMSQLTNTGQGAGAGQQNANNASGAGATAATDAQVIAQLQSQIAQLQNRIDSLNQQLANNSGQQGNNAYLQAQINALQAQVQQLSTLNSQLQSGQVHIFGSADANQGLQMPAGYGASGAGLQMPPGYPASGGGQVQGAETLGTYTVKKGDTLWNIAKKYYGDGRKWRKILEANPSALSRPGDTHTLKIAAQLVIPADN